jgi:hypothetical protein
MPINKKAIMKKCEYAKNQEIEKKETLRTFEERPRGF